VEVVVQRVSVQADVDTGAEVNVLSKTVYDELDPKPPIKQYVTMTQVGHNPKIYMNGFFCETSEDTIRQTLFGMEFLRQRKFRLDLGNGLMSLKFSVQCYPSG
jgi:hypothetical protein